MEERKKPRDLEVREKQVFIAGVPATASKHDILRAFESYGAIESISLPEKKSDKKENQSQIPQENEILRGFCIITFLDPRSAKLTLQVPKFHYMGRILTCIQFHSGLALERHNLMLSKRRIILKKIPLDLEEDRVKKVLENMAGTLQTFFYFSSENILNTNRRHLTASAIFEQPHKVELLVKLGVILRPDGKPMIVRPFISKIVKRQSSPLKNIEKESGKINSSDSQAKILKNSTTLEANKRLFCHSKTDPVGDKLNKFANLHFFHSQKPTKKLYHKVRELPLSELELSDKGNQKHYSMGPVKGGMALPFTKKGKKVPWNEISADSGFSSGEAAERKFVKFQLIQSEEKNHPNNEAINIEVRSRLRLNFISSQKDLLHHPNL